MISPELQARKREAPSVFRRSNRFSSHHARIRRWSSTKEGSISWIVVFDLVAGSTESGRLKGVAKRGVRADGAFLRPIGGRKQPRAKC